MRNSFGETALSRILPETLEQFLDSCTNHTNHPLHKDFKVGSNHPLHKDFKAGSNHPLHKDFKVGSHHPLHKDFKVGTNNHHHEFKVAIHQHKHLLFKNFEPDILQQLSTGFKLDNPPKPYTVSKNVVSRHKKPSLSQLERMERCMSGLCLRSFGTEARHIPLYLLQPWQDRFLCRDLDYFWDCIPPFTATNIST